MDIMSEKTSFIETTRNETIDKFSGHYLSWLQILDNCDPAVGQKILKICNPTLSI